MGSPLLVIRFMTDLPTFPYVLNMTRSFQNDLLNKILTSLFLTGPKIIYTIK